MLIIREQANKRLVHLRHRKNRDEWTDDVLFGGSDTIREIEATLRDRFESFAIYVPAGRSEVDSPRIDDFTMCKATFDKTTRERGENVRNSWVHKSFWMLLGALISGPVIVFCLLKLLNT